MAPDEKNPEEKEYEFHFKLEETPAAEQEGNALAALVRSQLKALLDVIVLTRDGQDLEADGFRFHESGSPVHKIFD